jgi:hypothetical protein
MPRAAPRVVRRTLLLVLLFGSASLVAAEPTVRPKPAYELLAKCAAVHIAQALDLSLPATNPVKTGE